MGCSPVAPGTVGSLGGLALAWGLHWAPTPLDNLLIIAIVLVGIPICDRAAKLLGKQDPGQVVFDEIAAIPILFVVNPLTWLTAILGFLWFRLFDVWKPWPASALEKLPGGLGIMADDLAAAIYAAIALWVTLRFIPAY